MNMNDICDQSERNILNLWKEKKISQQPVYKDEMELQTVLNEVSVYY
jgi:hypothetical protein